MLNEESLKCDLWEKKKHAFIWRGGGCVCGASVYLPRGFSLYAPGAGMTEKLAKLRSNPEGSELNISSEGDMIKLNTKGRPPRVMPFFLCVTKTSLSI